jgi:hypothetical protein
MSNAPDFCHNITLLTNETSYGYLSECWTEKRIADLLRICLPLIILPISLLSNCLSFLALRSRHMRGTSTAFFMLVLSVLDPLVLLTKNLVYFPTFIAANAISCKILYFLIYVLGYTNVWILVIMTADKFLAVWFPLKVSYFCTITRAKYVCILLLILTSIISFHHFWTIDSLQHPKNINQYFCYYDMIHYGSIQRIWRYVDFVIWCFLPFILILTLSVLIIYKLRQKSKNSQQRFSTNIKSDESMVAIFVLLFLNKFFFFLVENNIRLSKQKFNNQNIEMRSNQKSEVIRSRHRHITLMLLAVAVVFLLLTFPNSIYFVLEITYSFNQPPKDNNYNKWLRFHRLTILTVIMFQLSDLQHATNFYLYLLTSNKFRRSVIGIYQSLPRFLTCWCQQKKNSNLKLNKDQRDMSFRSSVSDTSMIIKNPRSQQQQSRKIFYSYNLLPSKSLTITTDLS